jgi:nucleolar protein 58
MLVLYETALGYCLFKLTDSAKISSGDLWKEFETPEKANKLLVASLSHLCPFKGTDVIGGYSLA